MRFVPAAGEGEVFGAGAGLGEGVVPFIKCDRSVDSVEYRSFDAGGNDAVGDRSPGDW